MVCKERASMDVWAGRIGVIIWLGDLRTVPITKNGGRFLLTEVDVPRQIGHNEYSVRAGESRGYFMIITGSEEPPLFVCDRSQKDVFYPKERLQTWVNTLFMGEINIPKLNFIRPGYLQH